MFKKAFKHSVLKFYLKHLMHFLFSTISFWYHKHITTSEEVHILNKPSTYCSEVINPSHNTWKSDLWW